MEKLPNRCVNLSYVSAELLSLFRDVVCLPSELWVSCPEIIGDFLHVVVGECPLQSGSSIYMKPTGEQIQIWCTEEESWDWDESLEVNLAREPKTINSLTAYLTGDE